MSRLLPPQPGEINWGTAVTEVLTSLQDQIDSLRRYCLRLVFAVAFQALVLVALVVVLVWR